MIAVIFKDMNNCTPRQEYGPPYNMALDKSQTMLRYMHRRIDYLV